MLSSLRSLIFPGFFGATVPHAWGHGILSPKRPGPRLGQRGRGTEGPFISCSTTWNLDVFSIGFYRNYSLISAHYDGRHPVSLGVITLHWSRACDIPKHLHEIYCRDKSISMAAAGGWDSRGILCHGARFHLLWRHLLPSLWYGHSTSQIQVLAGIVVKLLSGEMDWYGLWLCWFLTIDDYDADHGLSVQVSDLLSVNYTRFDLTRLH